MRNLVSTNHIFFCFDLILVNFVVVVGRSECARNPVRLFAILTNQRSGSGWFETLLNSHMNVSSHGEIFSVPERRVNVSTIVNTLDKIYNLDWLNSASKNECSAAIGLKWMLNQVKVLTLVFCEFRSFLIEFLF
jgi:hypothetical protein